MLFERVFSCSSRFIQFEQKQKKKEKKTEKKFQDYKNHV